MQYIVVRNESGYFNFLLQGSMEGYPKSQIFMEEFIDNTVYCSLLRMGFAASKDERVVFWFVKRAFVLF